MTSLDNSVPIDIDSSFMRSYESTKITVNDLKLLNINQLQDLLIKKIDLYNDKNIMNNLPDQGLKIKVFIDHIQNEISLRPINNDIDICDSLNSLSFVDLNKTNKIHVEQFNSAISTKAPKLITVSESNMIDLSYIKEGTSYHYSVADAVEEYELENENEELEYNLRQQEIEIESENEDDEDDEKDDASEADYKIKRDTSSVKFENTLEI